jgi:hypothetical protein
MEGIQTTNMSIPIPEGFIIDNRITGIVNTMGKCAGLEQNWGYYAKDKDGKVYILLYCNPGNYTIIDKESLDKIRIVNNKQVSWFIGKNGYAGCRTKINEKETVLTLHQYLMDHYGKGRGHESIDHINRNKLDNRMSNLRITTQSEQNTNRNKVSRQKTAKSLPEEIKDIILPKFVVYYRENINNNTYREFFTVEGHPIQKMKEKGISNKQTEQLKARRWATTKSNRVSIKDKLEQAKLYLIELDKLNDNSLYILKDINKPNTTEPRRVNLKPIQEEKNIIIEEIKEKQEIILNNSKPSHNCDISNINNSEKVFSNPIQWKVKQIFEAIQKNNENKYKEYCEQNNDICKIEDWNTKWASFVLSVKGKSHQESEPIIRSFLEDLRRIRHNHLCVESKNIVDRNDREQWPASTVVRAFLDGKINSFKEFTEKQSDDNPSDKSWQTRWNRFIKSLEDNKNNDEIMKELCSKFMTAQRIKRYRKNSKKISNI